MGLAVPPRAHYLRTILTELNRIASHLLWLATHALDIGAVTVLLWALREREEILKIFERQFGARSRVTRGASAACQTMRTTTSVKTSASSSTTFRAYRRIRNVLSENRIWLSRTVGIGVISAEDAIAIGLSGPALRGSGVVGRAKVAAVRCLRRHGFRYSTRRERRYVRSIFVRLEEMRQSRRIIDQALENLPDGPVNAKLPKIVKPPVGDYYHSIEGPKGEIGCYLVSDGTAQPWRARAAAVIHQSSGAEADVPRTPRCRRGCNYRNA